MNEEQAVVCGLQMSQTLRRLAKLGTNATLLAKLLFLNLFFAKYMLTCNGLVFYINEYFKNLSVLIANVILMDITYKQKLFGNPQ